MKNILLLTILLSIVCNTSAQIRFITGYQNANVDTAVSVANYSTNTICFSPHRDSLNTETVWYNFGITGFRTDTIITFLMNYNNIYYPPNYPVVSYNGKEYFNVKASQRNNINQFSVKPTHDTVFVSTGYPYTYNRLQKLIKSINGNKYFKIDSSFTTPKGNRLYLLTVTDHNTKSRTKKNVWIIARQHAFESISNFVVEGMINYLLSDKVTDTDILSQYTFYIVPMVDIDNVISGQSGRMSFPRDFNRDWNSPRHSEIETLEKWIKKSGKRRYDMFFDIHATYPGGRTTNVFSYFDIHGGSIQSQNLNQFWQRFYNLTHYRPKTIDDTNVYQEGFSADYYNAKKYKRLQFATTIECDWNVNSRGKVWQIADYLNLGENIIKAVPVK
ncbi:MAG: hypothetical protein J6V76_08535 [Bacteroidales bacterium]|nr:hypothetical protein [Bacteroidales bacterium]